ncbi:transmembrane amino acid transporter family protein [Actinidia rufa]|uniref:Transmembrane amino acid transporter family protein n=1 Tax=Actinidia rufa TaxID=165716 RepID=A0A7J0GH32_9ERIC|nr:transmembrane amino acid transporter family protein [Actinidia rufa]
MTFADRKHRRSPRAPLLLPQQRHHPPRRRLRHRWRRVVLRRRLQPLHDDRRRRDHGPPGHPQAAGDGPRAYRHRPRRHAYSGVDRCDLEVQQSLEGGLNGFGQQWWSKRSFLLLLTTLLVFAPLISFKRVDSLRYTSALSVGLAVVFVVITAGVAIVKIINGSIGMPRLLPELVDQASFWKLFTTVPIIVTAYICHHNIHPIENELRDPTQMKSIVRTSITLCLFVYVATSFFGFLLFGDHTLDDVLANFDADLGIPYSSLIDDVVRVSYCIHLMLVFPMVFFSLRLNVDGLLFPYAIPIAFDNRRFFSVTAALMGFIFLGANFVPSIWDAFQFTGATATVSVGFIFPAAIALRNIQGIATKNDRLVSWAMILLAVSSSTLAICSDIYSIFNSGSIAGN